MIPALTRFVRRMRRPALTLLTVACAIVAVPFVLALLIVRLGNDR